MPKTLFALAAVALSSTAMATAQRSPQVAQFVAVDAPVVAITNVRVIDGVGGAPEIELGVRVIGAGGPDRGDPAGQVQQWRREARLDRPA